MASSSTKSAFNAQQQGPSRSALNQLRAELMQPSQPASTSSSGSSNIRKVVSFNEALTVVSEIPVMETASQYFYTQEEIEMFRAEAYMEKVYDSARQQQQPLLPQPLVRPLIRRPPQQEPSRFQRSVSSGDIPTTTTATTTTKTKGRSFALAA